MIEFGVRLDQKDLARLKNNIPIYAKSLLAKSADALKKTGEQYYNIVISKIGQFRGGEMVFPDVYWEPLTPNWLEEKRKAGFVEEIWEAEGLIKAGVKVYGYEKTSDGYKLFVGLKDGGAANSYDFKTAFAKAVRNEFGVRTDNVPARPLFEPAKREMVHSRFQREMILKNFTAAVRDAYKVFLHVKQ